MVKVNTRNNTKDLDQLYLKHYPESSLKHYHEWISIINLTGFKLKGIILNVN